MFSTTLPSYHNNIYIGDFNLHISEEETTPAIFNDSIDAMGTLYQHIGFPTHKSGNILYLILSDITQSASVMTTTPGPYLIDYRAVNATPNIKKLKPMFGYQQVRKLHKVAQHEWIDKFNPDNVPLTDKLEELVPLFNTELTRMLDKLAPLKCCKINLTPKNPWYDMELKSHKIQMRKRGKEMA